MCVRYGSRQIYFCSEISENISIEMQKELAYTPPLTKRVKKKIILLFQSLKNVIIMMELYSVLWLNIC